MPKKLRNNKCDENGKSEIKRKENVLETCTGLCASKTQKSIRQKEIPSLMDQSKQMFEMMQHYK